VVEGLVTDPADVRGVMETVRPVAVVSCLASRTGEPADAWAVDHAAHSLVLKAAVAAGVGQFVLLSAICVQKPVLEFQRAKLAFEAELMAAPIDWSIVRATAFFKSLSGQVARVEAGRPFLVFGDGRLTACKPISDADLGRYLALCLTDPEMRNRVLPIGGPGPAVTPLDQAAMLERLTGRPVKVKRVPVAMMDAIIAGLALAGRLSSRLRAKAELARIGRYYATESMLVWDGARYDAAATPEFGTERLEDHYAAMLRGEVGDERGAHKVF
jgi:divinyl chlorophyllide a 8-vinyl-reductase